MNRLASLAQIKHYKTIPLAITTHSTLAASLRLFQHDSKYERLTYTHTFNPLHYTFIIEQMSRIGWIADEIDHHP